MITRLPRIALIWAAISVISCLPASAALVTGGVFERGLEGWEVFTTGTAAVTVLRGQGTGGGNCARLLAPEGETAVLVSAPLDLNVVGVPFDLQLRLRNMADSGPLQIGLAAAHTPGHPPEAEPLWALQPTASERWQTLRLTVMAPVRTGQTTALALSVADGADWAVERVELLAHRPPGVARHPQVGDAPVYPEPLGPDWQPEGLLDARTRQLVGVTELLVDLAGLQIRIPEQAECLRGPRQGVELYCTNRGSTEKQLTVSVQGPPDVRLPDWTLLVPAKTTIRFYLPIQRLLAGDCWLKLGFICQGEQAFAPVKLRCMPAYPVMGAIWPGEQPPAEDELLRSGSLGAGMHQMTVPDTAAGQFFERLGPAGGPVEWLLAVPEGLVKQLPAQAVAATGDRRHCWMPLPPAGGDVEQATAALCGLAGQLHTHDHSPNLFSFAFPLEYDRQGQMVRLDDGWRLTAARLDDCPAVGVGGLMVRSLALRMPPLPCATVLQASRDGRPLNGVSAYWAEFGQRSDPAQVRLHSREADMQLPFTVMVPELAASGDRRLDALKLGRIMASAAYQGATAVLTTARDGDGRVGLLAPAGADADGDPVALLHAALAAELAAAVPAPAPDATDTMSPAPTAQVTYKLFVRGDEGIVVMWNNTGLPVEVAVGLRSQPVNLRLLRLAWQGEFVQRQFQSVFRISGKALETQQPGIYLRLDPLDITCLSLRLVDSHAGWSRGVFPADEFKVELPARDRGQQWWERLFQ